MAAVLFEWCVVSQDCNWNEMMIRATCWVFVLATLLLKQISMIVMLDAMFQHGLGIFVRCWI